jgi:antitoxin component YwqK of YwqJK toxin-antitoxin module
MKPFCLTILLFSITGAFAQKLTKYYDFQWKESDAAHARFVSIITSTDSGWHRFDYFVHGPSLQMEGVYEDSACKIPNGQFTWVYPDGKVEMTGRYTHAKKQGQWLIFHPGGMPADSVEYNTGSPVGITLAWYPNGSTRDSAIYNPDGSGLDVSWFDNGNPSSAGRYTAGRKMHGKWKFYHKNGKLSAIELYDQGQLTQKQYYDTAGQAIADTTSTDREATFKGGVKNWLKYLENHLDFPPNFEITNSDQAAVVLTLTVDEDGNVVNPYVTIPFYPQFDKIALDVIRKSPKWQPAIAHHRQVQSIFRQPVIFSQPADE